MLTRTRSILRSADLVVAAIAIIALLLAGCTGEESTPEESSTTTILSSEESAPAGNQDLAFGSGVLPSTVPADFPIPEQAVVGSTLVDATRGLTEVILTYPADATAVSAFYTTNLPEFGYVVEESSGSDAKRQLSFSKDGLTGTITVDTAGSGVSQGSLRIVVVSG